METQRVIAELYKIVEERARHKNNIFGAQVWETHLLPVVRYAKQVATMVHADVEIVEIAALLHDIASITDKDLVEAHHVHGQEIAQDLLSDLGYPQAKIDSVKYCIFTHRGSQKLVRSTLEAQCVADGDAMSHFDAVYSLFRLALVTKNMNEFEARDFVYHKLERSWNKLSDPAKEIVRPKWEAVEILFKF